MSNTTPTPEQNAWAADVWSQLSRIQCAGVLHIALGYGERQAQSNAYIDQMALLAWGGLGFPLQQDVTRTLLRLQLLLRS